MDSLNLSQKLFKLFVKKIARIMISLSNFPNLIEMETITEIEKVLVKRASVRYCTILPAILWLSDRLNFSSIPAS